MPKKDHEDKTVRRVIPVESVAKLKESGEVMLFAITSMQPKKTLTQYGSKWVGDNGKIVKSPLGNQGDTVGVLEPFEYFSDNSGLAYIKYLHDGDVREVPSEYQNYALSREGDQKKAWLMPHWAVRHHVQVMEPVTMGKASSFTEDMMADAGFKNKAAFLKGWLRDYGNPRSVKVVGEVVSYKCYAYSEDQEGPDLYQRKPVRYITNPVIAYARARKVER